MNKNDNNSSGIINTFHNVVKNIKELFYEKEIPNLVDVEENENENQMHFIEFMSLLWNTIRAVLIFFYHAFIYIAAAFINFCALPFSVFIFIDPQIKIDTVTTVNSNIANSKSKETMSSTSTASSPIINAQEHTIAAVNNVLERNEITDNSDSEINNPANIKAGIS